MFAGSGSGVTLADVELDNPFNSFNCIDSNESFASVDMGEKLLAEVPPLDGGIHGRGDRRSGVVLPNPVTGESGLSCFFGSAGLCKRLMSGNSNADFCISMSGLLRFQAGTLAPGSTSGKSTRGATDLDRELGSGVGEFGVRASGKPSMSPKNCGDSNSKFLTVGVLGALFAAFNACSSLDGFQGLNIGSGCCSSLRSFSLPSGTRLANTTRM